MAESETTSLSDKISNASSVEEISGTNEHRARGLQQAMLQTVRIKVAGIESYIIGDTKSRPLGNSIA